MGRRWSKYGDTKSVASHGCLYSPIIILFCSSSICHCILIQYKHSSFKEDSLIILINILIKLIKKYHYVQSNNYENANLDANSDYDPLRKTFVWTIKTSSKQRWKWISDESFLSLSRRWWIIQMKIIYLNNIYVIQTQLVILIF